MKLFEYQAKDAFESRGIPVPKRRLCDSPDDVFSAAMDLGCPCVVKSQVLQGGRGKAGLVRPMATAADARAYAERAPYWPSGLQAWRQEGARRRGHRHRA
ncbi:hypothetical protein MASR2M48_23470 [Spirochaetota bacterium]